ncbi:MAG: hypothetical protein K1X88_09245 [Nannocystaceae bacterium]|nr:hypothetical protein [Nannocystaceae bacterium]
MPTAVRRRVVLPLLVAVAALGGCVSGDGMQTKLRDATTDYNKALRWRDIDRAAEFLPANSQQEFLATHEDFAKELVIVDYELTRLDLDKSSGVAASRAQIWWHADDSTVIESTMVDQLWQFHEGKFVLVDERRSSGERLGIFGEFVEDEHPWLPGLLAYRKSHHIGANNKQGAKPGRRKEPAGAPPSWGPAGDRGDPLAAERDQAVSMR